MESLSRRYGFNKVHYELLTKVVLLVYLVLTVFSMFYRPDFMSITCVSLGIYAVMNPQGITRSLFRMLVVFMLVSFVYDLVFLIFIHDADAEDELDSQMAVNVRRFSYFFCWVSFAFRPLVILVFWKDSLDFRRIIRHKSISEVQGGAGSSSMTH